MRRLTDLCQATLRDEMDLHRSYAREFDISEEEELEAEPMAPTTQGYTDFLVRTAAQGDFAELVASLLPCMWGFSEIGQRLAEGGRPSDECYAKWIDMYSSAEFAELATWGAARSPTAWQASYPRKFGSGSPPPSSRAAATSSRSGRWRGRESAGSPNPA
jgi:thiaminase/transcriptional activator TenA